MNNAIAPRLFAALFAAVLTIAMLAGVDSLASGEQVDARLAQVAVTQPA